MSIASEITRLQGAKADLATAIAGKGVTVPSATKLDGYADLVDAIPQGGGTLGTKTITANGTYNASSDGYDGYSKVTANVPNTYSASDEGKVVSNGALVAQTSDTVTTNDTYDTTLINSLTVNVSGGGGITISPMDYPVTVKNSYGSATTVNRIYYNATTLMRAGYSNITNGSSGTFNGLATDGTHFWISVNHGTTLKYNGVNATYTRDGNYFKVEIPAGFDGTIEFVLS